MTNEKELEEILRALAKGGRNRSVMDLARPYEMFL